MRGERQVIGLAAALACLAAAPAASAAQATAFQQNAARDGNSGETELTPPLGRRWAHDFDGALPSYPLVADGRVFVATSGNYRSAVHALELASGRPLWSRELTGGGFRGAGHAGLAYANGRLFVLEDAGTLSALAPATGQPLWSSAVGSSNEHATRYPPVAAEGMVFVADRDTVSGLDEERGLVLWRKNAAAVGGPATDGERVYTPLDGCRVSAMTAQLGVQLWQSSASCTGSSAGGAALYAGRVYAYSGSDGVELDRTIGSQVDTFPTMRLPAFAENTMLLTRERTLTARGLGSGVTRWHFEHQPAPYSSLAIATPPIVAGGTVYALASDGTLLALRLDDGALVWSRDVGASVEVSYGPRLGLAAGEGTLVVPAGDLLLAYTTGADAPGDAPGGATPPPQLTLRASRTETFYGSRRPVRLDVAYRAQDRNPQPASFTLEHDPFPFDRFEPVPNQSSVLDSGTADRDGTRRDSVLVSAERNTRYRIVSTRSGVESDPVIVYTQFGGRFRALLRRDRRLRLTATLVGPSDARLARRKMHAYRLRRGSRRGRRIAALRLRRAGRGRAFARKVVRVRRLRRSDRFFVCLVERRDDGFGRFTPKLRKCGRRRLRF